MLQNGCGLCKPSSICLVLQVNADDGAIPEGIDIFELPRIIPDDLGTAGDWLAVVRLFGIEIMMAHYNYDCLLQN